MSINHLFLFWHAKCLCICHLCKSAWLLRTWWGFRTFVPRKHSVPWIEWGGGDVLRLVWNVLNSTPWTTSRHSSYKHMSKTNTWTSFTLIASAEIIKWMSSSVSVRLSLSLLNDCHHDRKQALNTTPTNLYMFLASKYAATSYRSELLDQ